MINSEVFIIKRDGKKETFSLDKIKNAIAKAFLSVGSFATQDVITTVLSRVSVSDGMNVEEIQNQVEVALMAEHYYSVAKAYMLYRQKHLEDREVRDKLKFLLDYCDASNPATGSKYAASGSGCSDPRKTICCENCLLQYSSFCYVVTVRKGLSYVTPLYG